MAARGSERAMARRWLRGPEAVIALVAAFCWAAPPAQAGTGFGDLALQYLTTGGATGPGVQAGPVVADCGTTSGPIGGGIVTSGGYREQYANSFFPQPDGDDAGSAPEGWRVYADNTGADAQYFLAATAVCTAAPQTSRQTVSANYASAPGQRVSGVVFCPGGLLAASGGVVATGLFGEQRIAASAPFDSDQDGKPDDGWRVKVDNIGSDAEAFNVYAICADFGGISYRSARATADAKDRSKLRAPCKRGRFAIGGGVAARGPHRSTWIAETTHTDPTGKPGWKAELDNRSRRDRKFTVHAICHA